jgi:hypothetical protein
MNNHYSPYEDYDEIIPREVQESLNEGDKYVVRDDYMSDEELAENGAAVIVCLFISVLLLIALAIGFCITFFK